jgi:hypothetical protein
MQTLLLSLLIAIGSLLGLLYLSDRRDPDVRTVVIRIDGTGTATIVIDADGDITTRQQSMPCEIDVSVRTKFGFSANRTDGTGDMDVEMEADGVLRGKTSSPRGAIGRLEFHGTKLILNSITGL